MTQAFASYGWLCAQPHTDTEEYIASIHLEGVSIYIALEWSDICMVMLVADQLVPMVNIKLESIVPPIYVSPGMRLIFMVSKSSNSQPSEIGI